VDPKTEGDPRIFKSARRGSDQAADVAELATNSSQIETATKKQDDARGGSKAVQAHRNNESCQNLKAEEESVSPNKAMVNQKRPHTRGTVNLNPRN